MNDTKFDIAFTCRGVLPGVQGKEGGSYLEVTFEAAKELTYEEYGRRKKVKPEEEVLREAKKLTNPNHKAMYYG